MSYNPEQHPEGGTELGISYNGKLYINPTNKKYMESLNKPKSLKHIEEKALKGTASFQKKRTINDDYNEGRELTDRLVLIQG